MDGEATSGETRKVASPGEEEVAARPADQESSSAESSGTSDDTSIADDDEEVGKVWAEVGAKRAKWALDYGAAICDDFGGGLLGGGFT